MGLKRAVNQPVMEAACGEEDEMENHEAGCEVSL